MARSGRIVNGILLLDKPNGMTSNRILQQVKWLYQAKKAGHTGALDPLATGMLPICLGEATKFSQFLLDSDKRYRVIARLGQRTDTSDSEGKIITEREVLLNQQDVLLALEKFRGNIKQIPSMYSALKYQGKPLYEYARNGIVIPREARNICIYSLDFIRFHGNELELEIHCSKGTYIRTIIDDLGEVLGCGAHVIYLHRLQVADYPVEKMVTIEQLQLIKEQELDEAERHLRLDALLLPVDSAAKSLPIVNLNKHMVNYFQQGQAIQVSGVPENGLVRVFNQENNQFLGVAEIDHNGNVAPRRLVVES